MKMKLLRISIEFDPCAGIDDIDKFHEDLDKFILSNPNKHIINKRSFHIAEVE